MTPPEPVCVWAQIAEVQAVAARFERVRSELIHSKRVLRLAYHQHHRCGATALNPSASERNRVVSVLAVRARQRHRGRCRCARLQARVLARARFHLTA